MIQESESNMRSDVLNSYKRIEGRRRANINDDPSYRDFHHKV